MPLLLSLLSGRLGAEICAILRSPLRPQSTSEVVKLPLHVNSPTFLLVLRCWILLFQKREWIVLQCLFELLFDVLLQLLLLQLSVPLGLSLRLRRGLFLRRLLLRQAGHDLDFLRVELMRVVHLEVDIFNDESPDFVAKAVGVKVSLRIVSLCCRRRTEFVYHTLKVIRALTFSFSTLAMLSSKFCIIRMAS